MLLSNSWPNYLETNLIDYLSWLLDSRLLFPSWTIRCLDSLTTLVCLSIACLIDPCKRCMTFVYFDNALACIQFSCYRRLDCALLFCILFVIAA